MTSARRSACIMKSLHNRRHLMFNNRFDSSQERTTRVERGEGVVIRKDDYKQVT